MNAVGANTVGGPGRGVESDSVVTVEGDRIGFTVGRTADCVVRRCAANIDRADAAIADSRCSRRVGSDQVALNDVVIASGLNQQTILIARNDVALTSAGPADRIVVRITHADSR